MRVRSEEPSNQHTVPVLSTNGKPLMPTRPSRARRLMKCGRAKHLWRKGTFCIKMLDVAEADAVVDGVELAIDPGAKETGIVVFSDDADGVRIVHDAVEVVHRGKPVTGGMGKRSSHRGNRRGRKRNRKPRCNNRRRKDGWLPPSMETRRVNTKTMLQRKCEIFPVRKVHVETTRFDTQLMEDAEISGNGYQQGTLSGWQLRQYVYHRDGRKCRYCGTVKAERYEIDHVVPRSRGGSDRVGNLVVACQTCNVAKSNMPVEEFLKGKAVVLKAIRRLRSAPLAEASQMNIITPRLLGMIEKMDLLCETHDAYTTAYTRHRLEVAKTHVNDALCLGAPKALSYVPEKKTVIRSVGHGDRQMLRPPDKHGNPRGQAYRDYCALPRQMQGYTRTPGHRARHKRVCGIASGDYVRIEHRKHGIADGYAVVAKNTGRVGVMLDGKQISVNAEEARLLWHNDGYRVSVKANV